MIGPETTACGNFEYKDPDQGWEDVVNCKNCGKSILVHSYDDQVNQIKEEANHGGK